MAYYPTDLTCLRWDFISLLWVAEGVKIPFCKWDGRALFLAECLVGATLGDFMRLIGIKYLLICYVNWFYWKAVSIFGAKIEKNEEYCVSFLMCVWREYKVIDFGNFRSWIIRLKLSFRGRIQIINSKPLPRINKVTFCLVVMNWVR